MNRSSTAIGATTSTELSLGLLALLLGAAATGLIGVFVADAGLLGAVLVAAGIGFLAHREHCAPNAALPALVARGLVLVALPVAPAIFGLFAADAFGGIPLPTVADLAALEVPALDELLPRVAWLPLLLVLPVAAGLYWVKADASGDRGWNSVAFVPMGFVALLLVCGMLVNSSSTPETTRSAAASVLSAVNGATTDANDSYKGATTDATAEYRSDGPMLPSP